MAFSRVVYAVRSIQPLYHDLVLAITNADTVITLVVPSTIIIVCNVRISIALSHFYRSVEFNSLRRSSTAVSAASPYLVNQQRTPATRCHRAAAADRRRSWAAQSNVSIYSNSSYNRLQMKVSLSLCRVRARCLFLRRWLQLRFDCDSTTLRKFDDQRDDRAAERRPK